MKKESLNDFFIAIKPFGELWSPVKNGDSYVLDTIKNYSDIDLSALRTKIPFKKLLLPPKFSIFFFDSTGITQPSFEELTNHVIFGMNPCDIHALMIPDNFLPCIPVIPTTWSIEKNCNWGAFLYTGWKVFLKTTNTHYAEKGFNLSLTDLDDFFIIWVGSSLGDDMIRECLELINEKIEKNPAIVQPTQQDGEAVGAVEAPRGTLYHHYHIERDLVSMANFVIPTRQNLEDCEKYMRKAVEGLLSQDADDKEITFQCEMIARTYDACISCSTHLVHIKREEMVT